MGLSNEEAEEVYEKASAAQAEVNSIVQGDNDLDYSHFDEVIYHLEIIQRRTDPAQWKEY